MIWVTFKTETDGKSTKPYVMVTALKACKQSEEQQQYKTERNKHARVMQSPQRVDKVTLQYWAHHHDGVEHPVSCALPAARLAALRCTDSSHTADTIC
jgi:hypothetical protein